MQTPKVLIMIFLASMLCIVATSQSAQAAERAVLLHVPGIDSLPAAAEVQSVLKDIDGVIHVRTDLVAHTATILFDDKNTTLGMIRKTLKKAKLPAQGQVKFLKLSIFET
jgi:copper chaperone CopZ